MPPLIKPSIPTKRYSNRSRKCLNSRVVARNSFCGFPSMEPPTMVPSSTLPNPGMGLSQPSRFRPLKSIISSALTGRTRRPIAKKRGKSQRENRSVTEGAEEQFTCMGDFKSSRMMALTTSAKHHLPQTRNGKDRRPTDSRTPSRLSQRLTMEMMLIPRLSAIENRKSRVGGRRRMNNTTTFFHFMHHPPIHPVRAPSKHRDPQTRGGNMRRFKFHGRGTASLERFHPSVGHTHQQSPGLSPGN